jgi:ubiquinone/menaquinone biosynthesis C-methylase UbiE
MTDVSKFYVHQPCPKILDLYTKDQIKNYFYQKTKNLTIKLLDLKGSESILDVGCGEAFLINRIKLKHPKTKVVGIDIMKECLVNSVKRFKDPSLVLGEANKLPFADSIFDRVTCTAVLEYLPNPLLTIQEIYRVTKYGGIVVFDVPGTFHLQNYLEDFLVRKIFRSIPFHKNYMFNRIERWIKYAGFKKGKTQSARFLGSIFFPFVPKLYIPGIGSYYWCSEQFAKRLLKIDALFEHMFGQHRFFKLFGGSWFFQCLKTQHNKEASDK